MSAPAQYRKKPVVIEAVQFDGTRSNTSDILAWIGKNGGQAIQASQFGFRRIEITTLEGTMRVSIGDWVIRGVQGEFYPCKPGIFAETYELVRDGA